MHFENWWASKRGVVIDEPAFALLREAWGEAQAAEREACAKVCEDVAEHYGEDGGCVADHCACDILERSNVRANRPVEAVGRNGSELSE